MATEAANNNKTLLAFLFIALFALALYCAMADSPFNKITCSYRGCNLKANTMMKSPAGTVAAFCDDHSATMYAEGWRIYP